MKEKLHILHLPKWYPNPEDPQLGIFIRKQIQAASRFHTQSVLYIKSVENLDTQYTIEVIQIGKVKEFHIFYRKPMMKSKQLILLRKLFNLGFKEIENSIGKPNVLHVHNLITPAIWADQYAKKNNLPWILSEHWSGYTSYSGAFDSKLGWEKKLWRLYSEKAVCTIAVSDFLQEALKKNRIGKNHMVIPNVVEANKVEAKREDDTIRILNVSDMVDDIKNISGLIRVFSSIAKELKKIKLSLVGGGDDLDKLRKQVQKLGLNEKIEFLGRLKNEDVLNLYNEIDFVVINSRVETFSVVAAESIMAGKPVVTTRCGGVEEFISDKQGILIPIDNDEELHQAMLKMIEGFGDYAPEELKNHAKDQFSSESIGKSLAQLYESVIL